MFKILITTYTPAGYAAPSTVMSTMVVEFQEERAAVDAILEIAKADERMMNRGYRQNAIPLFSQTLKGE